MPIHLTLDRNGVAVPVQRAVSAGSPNATIRAARGLGWLSDEDAQAAIKLGAERNLAVHMYRDRVGAQIEQHLPAHAALLRRWLDALQQRTGGD